MKINLSEDKTVCVCLYTERKHIPKKTVMKLKPGAWVIVKWMYGPDQMHLLLEKAEAASGTVSLVTWLPERPGSRYGYNTPKTDQVIGICGDVQTSRLPNILDFGYLDDGEEDDLDVEEHKRPGGPERIAGRDEYNADIAADR